MPESTLPDPADQRRGGDGDTRSVAVVIPMPSDPPWELFDAIPSEIPIIVSDDSAGALTAPPRDNVFVFDDASQQAYCGSHYRAMPHRSAASRNVGHYIAWKEGFDVIVALDFDCRTRHGWLTTHLEALTKVVEASARVPDRAGGWLNSIERPGVYARGYPYEWRDPELSRERHVTATGEVKVNMGIWDGILDMNGVDKLQGGEPADPGPVGDRTTVALGPVPLCGMNTAFAAELVPAYYFLPDAWVDGWQLSRHDDIWGGYVLERLLERRGDLLTYGGPVVEHTKQTRLERVVVLEQWMHLMSVGFYRLVDEAVEHVGTAEYGLMFAHLVEEMARALEHCPEPVHYRRVYAELVDWMGRWARACA